MTHRKYLRRTRLHTHVGSSTNCVCVCVCVCVCMCMCVCVRVFVWHGSFICVTWLIHMRTRWPLYFCSCTNRGYCYGWHDADKSGVCICATWFILINDMTHSFAGHSCVYVSVRGQIGIIHKCDMTHPCAWHDLSTCVTWLIHMCDMTHSYVWQIRVQDTVAHTCWFSSWTIEGVHTCDMTRSCAWHDLFICLTYSFICVTWLIHDMQDTVAHTCQFVTCAYMSVRDMMFTSHIRTSWMSHVTHYDILCIINESCRIHVGLCTWGQDIRSCRVALFSRIDKL